MKSQKRAIMGFALFLAFMAVCTLVTKGIYKSGLARVTTDTPRKQSIYHEITASGTIKAGQEYGIYLSKGLRVNTIFVQPGDKVAQGDILFQIETADLGEVTTAKELELKSIRAQLRDRKNTISSTEEESGKTIARLKEDYENLMKEQDLIIERKRQEYYAAKEAREDAERENNGSVSGGNGWSGESGTALETLRKAEKQASMDVEDAILAKQEAILSWSRQMEDAGTAAAAASAELVSLEGQGVQLEKELNILKELQKQDGYVRAKEAGTILENRLSIGERTVDGACMLYAADGGEGMVEIPVSAEALKYLSIGDRVEISYRSRNGGTKKEKGSIQYLEKLDTGAVARVKLADSGLIIGQNVTMKYTHQSESYQMVIPAQALYSNQWGGKFLYTVEEQEGILGVETRVVRIDVNVIDQSSQYAAVEGAALNSESRIVVDSTKELTENDVVRVMK